MIDKWEVAFLEAQIKASIELEELRRRQKVTQAHAIETLVKLYTRVIDQLTEELEYEKLKADAYRMVWSAREYLMITDPENYKARWVLTSALNTLEAERVDGMAIREKYNPKVVKLKKRIPEDQFDQNAEYAKLWRPSELVFSNPFEPDWSRHHGPKC